MKLSSILGLSASAVFTVGKGYDYQETKLATNSSEAAIFWNRLIQNDELTVNTVTPVVIKTSRPVASQISVPVGRDVDVTGSCVIEFDTTCTISGNSSSAGKPCDTHTLGMEPCFERPVQITMVYNGGDCGQSHNAQALKFTCADSNGGPPTMEGAMSFIIATDIIGNGITYFEGMVPIGSQYVLGDGANRVGTDMFINIFTPDRTTLLQAVQYHTSCTSSPLELKDRFGASQVVQFQNAAQGSVSCFTDFSFRADISFPTSGVAEGVAITSLIANTNFAGIIDLTNQTSGEIISSDAIVNVVLGGRFDASVRRMYVIMFAVEGTQNSTGATCMGLDTLSFEAGNTMGVPSFITPTAPTAKIKTLKGPTRPSVVDPLERGISRLSKSR